MKKEDWVKHFEGRGYRASVDAPSDMFYRYRDISRHILLISFKLTNIFRELMEAFPNAKVVLTVRRPETWHKSVSSTIHKGVEMQGPNSIG